MFDRVSSIYRRFQDKRPADCLSRALICLFLFGIIDPHTFAQKPPQASSQVPKTPPGAAQLLSSYEGQNVTAIEIAGRPELNTSQFASLFSQKAGQPFSKDKVEQTVAALKATGKFADVRVEAEAEAQGVRVVLVLEPAVYIGIFQFPGAGRFAYARLIQVANYTPQTPFNAAYIEQDRQNLVAFFRQQGYFEAEVNSEVHVDSANGLANVLFNAMLHRRAKFGDIKIEGTTAEQAAKLKHNLQRPWARLRGAAIRPGRVYHYSTPQGLRNTFRPGCRRKVGWEPRSSWPEPNITRKRAGRTCISMSLRDPRLMWRSKALTFGVGRAKHYCPCTRVLAWIENRCRKGGGRWSPTFNQRDTLT